MRVMSPNRVGDAKMRQQPELPHFRELAFDRRPERTFRQLFSGALQDLERLFGVPIGMIEPGPIRNPFFKQALAAGQVVLFEAA